MLFVLCLFINDQRGFALLLNNTRKQWVDLGVLNDACVTRPDTCGSAGATVAFWMRITFNHSTSQGVISSQCKTHTNETDFSIYFDEELR